MERFPACGPRRLEESFELLASIVGIHWVNCQSLLLVAAENVNADDVCDGGRCGKDAAQLLKDSKPVTLHRMPLHRGVKNPVPMALPQKAVNLEKFLAALFGGELVRGY